MMNEKNKRAKINITIDRDPNNIPEKMTWEATDNPDGPKKQECKAMLLALFDKKQQETIKVDLWTKEMMVNEMDRFMFQTLRSLTDTYYQATQNAKLASQMQQFVHFFGLETGIIPKEEPK
ncbi:MAG: gliding motility protein GldC [Saprospiraceae bacterium]|nr:gliding motility protein GldC [Saprospiraceae bacterium]MCB9322597.1 gliding motility protein GldC [Lewinellaceae bacterium]